MVYIMVVLVLIVWRSLFKQALINHGLKIAPQTSVANAERTFSQAEIAAKSMGYWESALRKATTSEQRETCFNNVRQAQLMLMKLTGDFVPIQAKQMFALTEPQVACETSATTYAAPENVVSLAHAKEYRKDSNYFNP